MTEGDELWMNGQLSWMDGWVTEDGWVIHRHK